MNILKLALTRDEAIVLFELLSRENTKKCSTVALMHPSEQTVLWRIEAALEKELTEPFESSYRGILDAARKRLAGAIEDKKEEP